MRCLMFFVLLHACNLHAGELWFTMPLTSWHKEDKPYNEKNLGIGFQYDFNNTWSIGVVRYPNSFNTWTTAIGFPYSPTWLQGQFGKLLVKPSISPTFFRGYSEDKWELVPIPTIDLLWNRKFGISAITDFRSFVGFSIKLNEGVLE